tara:strand:- start:2386 stop:2709 length:324 start_codon:yes stop_codon:yes gene_type:complete
MKITKPQIKNIMELKKRGGAVMTSEWTTGSGRHTKRRSVPPYCQRISRFEAHYEKYPKRILSVFEKHPRCEAVIAITNMRRVNALIDWIEYSHKLCKNTDIPEFAYS